MAARPMILVADDQEAMRNTIIRVLALEGYGYEVASTGSRAWELLEQKPFQLALLDINMPGMDGFAVVERMKSSPLHREIPIIMITGAVDSSSVLRCKALGVDDYIVKPYKIATLLTRIDTVLGKPVPVAG